MRRVSFSFEHIRIGEPLPFSVWDENGAMVAGRGYTLLDAREYEVMLGKRDKLLVNALEYERFQRAYKKTLNELIHGNRPLGSIAGTRLVDMGAVVAREKAAPDRADRAGSPKDEANRSVPAPKEVDASVKAGRGSAVPVQVADMPASDEAWSDLQEQAHGMLLGSDPETFLDRLETLQKRLSQYARQNPDGTLLALITLSARAHDRYSGTHAMLVSVICGLAARDVLNWSTVDETVLCHAALTMNIGMTAHQDRLARQKEVPSPRQRNIIKNHPIRSVAVLEDMGVTHPDLLEAVRDHHACGPGALSTRKLAQRAARLIQRADIFAAAISPRGSRAAATTSRAMKNAYFDENSQVDEAGAALVKSVGIYPPGSFVRLASEEVAMVVQRGINTSAPRAAVVLNRSGLPNTELTLRDTNQAEWRVNGSVPFNRVKVSLNLSRLLPLTRLPWGRFEF